MLINIQKHHPGRGIMKKRNTSDKNLLYPVYDCCHRMQKAGYQSERGQKHRYTRIKVMVLQARGMNGIVV